MQEIVLIQGYPASGKTSLVQSQYTTHTHINRDTLGGSVIDLLPLIETEISKGNSVVVDGLFATRESRKPFIDLANQNKVSISCVTIDIAAEDAQINALNRQWDRYGKIFFDQEQLKEVAGDPNMFPPAVIFSYRKKLEKPQANEGFEQVTKIKFVREPWVGKNKAVFLDFDDTIRTVTEEAKYKFPICTDEVVILPNRYQKLKSLLKEGYRLVGVSNQSAIAKGTATQVDIVECFEHTLDKLDINIDYMYCPHNPAPVKCFCRKPQSGMAVHYIRKYDLDPSQCIMVGDQTSDKTFATRIGFEFVSADDFFAS